MRFLIFLLAAFLLSIWVAALSLNIPAGNRALPKLGPLLSPFQGFLQQAEGMNSAEFISHDQTGLTQTVEVHFDERLVPHIFANSLSDAYQVLGSLHAKYRLFQMDLVSRSTSGRLSEILGPTLLKRDQLQRRKGLAWSAEQAEESWKSSPRYPLMEAYASGYNNFLQQLSPKEYPLEFKLLGYQPEEWTPYRTALLMKSMAETLCSRNYDIAATNTRQKIGAKMFDALYPNQMSIPDPIVPKQVEYPFVPLLPDKNLNIPNIEDLIGHVPLPNAPGNVGSNNWVVGGSKTKSGAPILANDPHLALTLPSIWYEAHIITPDLNVYGVTLPGFPGIIIGFNDKISWGITNVGQDVTDWYEIDWVNDQKLSYWLDGEQRKVDLRIEDYNVKGVGSIKDTVKYTHWGPIVHESNSSEDSDLAMHWLPHLSPNPEEIETFMALNAASNFDEFTKATQKFQSPPQNMVFAANNGDIGIRIQGKFPLKRPGQGLFINKGNDTKNDWQGFVPMDHNPAMLNPERGFVSSANQKSTAENYPYYYNGRFEQYRGRYLNSKLRDLESIEVEDMRKLQYDNYSLKAEEFVPLLLQQVAKSEINASSQQYLEQLKTWDFQYSSTSEVATFFELWLKVMKKLTWDEVQGSSGGPAMLAPQDWVLRDLLRDQPEHPFFDQVNSSEIETASIVATLAFEQAVAEMTQLQASGKSAWRKYNRLIIPHLSRIPAFAVNDVDIGGSGDCLNANKGSFGPSWRMIVAMGPEQKAYGVFPGGQSGNPGSPYYDTGITTWAKGELNELEFVKSPGELSKPLFIHQFNPGK